MIIRAEGGTFKLARRRYVQIGNPESNPPPMAHPLDTISGILTAATEYLAEQVALLRPASKPTQINHEELPAKLEFISYTVCGATANQHCPDSYLAYRKFHFKFNKNSFWICQYTHLFTSSIHLFVASLTPQPAPYA